MKDGQKPLANINRTSISNSYFTLIFLLLFLLTIITYGTCVFFFNYGELLISVASLFIGYFLIYLTIRDYIQKLVKSNPDKAQPKVERNLLIIGIIINIIGCLSIIFLGMLSFFIALVGMYFIYIYIEPIEKELKHKLP